jgi:hypothetical protein
MSASQSGPIVVESAPAAGARLDFPWKSREARADTFLDRRQGILHLEVLVVAGLHEDRFIEQHRYRSLAAPEENAMNHMHPSLHDQPQETPLSQRTSAKGLAPMCKDPLTRYWKGRPPRQAWRLLRQAVFERDEWTCVYCGKRTGTLTADHVVPVSRGGSSTLDNLVTACLDCNTAKATRTPEEWQAQSHQGKRGV